MSGADSTSVDAAAREAGKRNAAQAAAALVEDGMLVGLGTGTTVAHLLDALGERVRDGLSIRTVGTSLATEHRAAALGIPVESFSPLAAVDLAIDGIDEIDAEFRAIKGGGGALLREKVVAQAATRMVAIADAGKQVADLGAGFPVALEVLGFALGFIASQVGELGGRTVRRGETLTDQGNPLLDCHFGAIADARVLARELDAIPGVLAHGLFLDEIDALCIGTADGAHWIDKRTD